MTNTRNNEVDNTLKAHDKAIAEIQTALVALSKQQEEILKAVRDKGVHSAGGSFGSFSGSDGDFRTSKPFRIGKIDFPNFSGDDVEGWVYRCEHFFAMDATPDASKVRCAAIHLEGDALQWHRAYMKTRNATVAEVPWADYVRSISARFSAALFEDPLEEMASLTQTGSLQELNSAFDSLLNKVNLSETQAVSLYLKALKPDIRGPVKMFKPSTLHEAYGLARIQAINNTSLMKRLNEGEGGPQPEDVKIIPPANASKLPLLPTPTNELPSKPGMLSSKRLTSKELELKRAKGECFWCTERYVPGHKCTNKQIYMLKVIDDEEPATYESIEGDEDKVTWIPFWGQKVG